MLRAGAGDNLQVGTSRLEALPAAPGGPPTQPEHPTPVLIATQLGLPWIKGTRSPRAVADMEEDRVSRIWWRPPPLKPEHVRGGETGYFTILAPGYPA